VNNSVRSDGPLAGQTAIVAGAAHGIGRAICIELAAAGAACDLDEEGLAHTSASLLQAVGRDCLTGVVDVTSTTDVQKFVSLASSTRGEPSILVTNAGGIGGQRMHPVDQIEMAEWRRLFSVLTLDTTLQAEDSDPGQTSWTRRQSALFAESHS
jgi:NAD(P)-dependent dehydrogenase (short-subunit alcohol dehydrogenase family)